MPHCARQPNYQQGGYAALWVVILLALMGVAGMAFASMDPETKTPLLWLGGCVAVAAIGLAIEVRHDFFEFCKFAGSFAFIAAIGCGLVVGLGEESPVALASAIVLGIASIAALVTSHRLSNAEEILPNVLLDHFKKKELSELGGVQFGLTHSDVRVEAGGELLVQIHAQNGMDTERTVELQLKRPTEIGRRSGHLAFDKEARMILPAGAAGTLTIPVAIHPKARHSYPITVEPKVTGSGGTRLRVYRARVFRQKIGGGMQVLALFAGFFVWGGGFTIKLKVSKNKNWKSMPVEEASPSTAEVFYEPDRSMLEQMRMRM